VKEARKLILPLAILLITIPMAVAEGWAKTYKIENSDIMYPESPLIMEKTIYLPGIYQV